MGVRKRLLKSLSNDRYECQKDVLNYRYGCQKDVLTVTAKGKAIARIIPNYLVLNSFVKDIIHNIRIDIRFIIKQLSLIFQDTDL